MSVTSAKAVFRYAKDFHTLAYRFYDLDNLVAAIDPTSDIDPDFVDDVFERIRQVLQAASTYTDSLTDLMANPEVQQSVKNQASYMATVVKAWTDKARMCETALRNVLLAQSRTNIDDSLAVLDQMVEEYESDDDEDGFGYDDSEDDEYTEEDGEYNGVPPEFAPDDDYADDGSDDESDEVSDDDTEIPEDGESAEEAPEDAPQDDSEVSDDAEDLPDDESPTEVVSEPFPENDEPAGQTDDMLMPAPMEDSEEVASAVPTEVSEDEPIIIPVPQEEPEQPSAPEQTAEAPKLYTSEEILAILQNRAPIPAEIVEQLALYYAQEAVPKQSTGLREAPEQIPLAAEGEPKPKRRILSRKDDSDTAETPKKRAGGRRGKKREVS